MQTDCYLQSTTNPLKPRQEQFLRGNSKHIANFRHNRLWVKILRKNVLFSSHRSSLNSFIQLCEEHCATEWHIRKILAPFSFSRVQLFSPLFHFSFIPFSFRFYFFSNFRCVFTKTIYSAHPRRIIVNDNSNQYYGILYLSELCARVLEPFNYSANDWACIGTKYHWCKEGWLLS